MFPTNIECLIGISDAFSPFCLRVSVILPTCSLYPQQKRAYSALYFAFTLLTSTEARWPIRDGDRVGRGRQSEGSTAETARKRLERPWTAARTMEVLRRCPLAIAQRLAHRAIAVSTAVLGQSHNCATPAGMDLYIQLHARRHYRVQSLGFPKIVYSLVKQTQDLLICPI